MPSGWQRLGIPTNRLWAEGDTVGSVLEDLEQRWPALGAHWRTGDGGYVRHLQLFLNGEPVPASRVGAMALAEGDALDILMPISGG